MTVIVELGCGPVSESFARKFHLRLLSFLSCLWFIFLCRGPKLLIGEPLVGVVNVPISRCAGTEPLNSEIEGGRRALINRRRCNQSASETFLQTRRRLCWDNLSKRLHSVHYLRYSRLNVTLVAFVCVCVHTLRRVFCLSLFCFC